MSQALTGNFGFDDVPAAIDSLSISSYINGLVGFIHSCPSPMTLAVQGNWGTGKTSAMLQIREALSKDDSTVQTIFFNTWQYAQFDLGENLAISMLKAIAEGLEGDESAPQEKNLDNLKRLIFKAGRLYASKAVPAVLNLAGLAVAGAVVGAAVETGQEMAKGAPEKAEELDSVKILSSLRRAFEAAVADSGKRLVVFIDDLDRLAPGRAIEVMEAIKVFLDVPNCVFVLAIDFDVVKQGVQEKYQMKVSDRRARSFFDKIIQVPFHMPVARYKMRPFFEQGLNRAGVNITEESLDRYMELSSASVGSNPRSTKRLLNTFLLLKSILGSEAADQDSASATALAPNYLHLFGTLCLQTAFPEAYTALAEAGANADPAEEFTSDTDEDDDAKFARWGIPEDELRLFARFYEELTNAFTENGKFVNDAFNKAFSQSTITSVTSTRRDSSRVVKVFDKDERRQRTESKRDPAVVDLGFQFEKELTLLDEVFAGQTNPIEWTMRMDVDQPRIGLLTLRKDDLKVALEFKTSQQTIDEITGYAQSVEDQLSAGSSDESPSGADRKNLKLRIVKQANGRFVLVEITGIKTPADVSHVAAILRPKYQLAAARV